MTAPSPETRGRVCPDCGETPSEASARWARIVMTPNFDPEGAPTPCDHAALAPARGDAAQTDSVDEIEAAVHREMGAASASDPRAPWADLALALCQRIRTGEAECAEMREMLIACAEALELEGVGCGGSRECGSDPCTACRARALSSGDRR